MYNMLKLPSTQQPDPVNLPHAASASTSADHDLIDLFDIVAKPNCHNKYSDGDDDYFSSPPDQYSEMGLIQSNIDYDDDSAFADEEPEEDMSYDCDDEEKDCRGRKLSEGGTENPMFRYMDPVHAAAVMKIW